MDLRTRLSADYSNVKLMEADQQTYPKGAVLQALGLISDGESYMDDKRMVLRDASGTIPESKTKAEAERRRFSVGERSAGLGIFSATQTPGEDDKVANVLAMPFVNPINEKLALARAEGDTAGVQVGVVCRKGRKGSDDHTPNQDSFSITLLDDNTLIALVCDGHGPFGHLVSQRCAQSGASLISSHLRAADDDRSIADKIKSAVVECQNDIVKFAGDIGFPVENSGSSLACLVVEPLDPASKRMLVVHVAWCGDSKIVAGKYGKKDTESILKETHDHTPDDPAELKRIESAGGEVREIAGGSKRIYVKGTNLPGLAITRAIGDASVSQHGVTAEPEYERWEFPIGESVFVTAASDGVWEFMKAEEAHKIMNKKLRLVSRLYSKDRP
ncbi:hypothetical protein FOL47_009326 [Perkinsus chesapeaki]|uniref:PPM-type phosphatase domain-containing protein n=1 Tax=Perkinsus chesapeaki TaxID=330153 RepID=A0A7J6L912_PERCH|nr:hypothetical protein FOL47_009326 [Perkinsus chesapeaki]